MDGPYAFLGITVGKQVAPPSPILPPTPLMSSHASTPILGAHPVNVSPHGGRSPTNSVNPATNDAPLEFNVNKNKPPMAVSSKVLDDGQSSREDERRRRSPDRDIEIIRRRSPDRDIEIISYRCDRRDRRDRDRDRDRNREKKDRGEKLHQENRNRSLSPYHENGTPLGMPPAVDGMQQQWGMMTFPMVPMGTDPNMMNMMPVGFNQFGFVNTGDPALAPVPMMPVMPGPVKEIIHCKSCTLFPPNPMASCRNVGDNENMSLDRQDGAWFSDFPGAPPPTTRERPPGCRTIFVGGLPENITEEIIREVFERCGEITTIRMSKKNFCHIRYETEVYVDNGIFLSGYRIRIGSNTDPPNTGRLHVDYAQARDDLYEWECRQRQLQREHRHRERMEQERLRPPSPPPIVHYSDHEASLLAEKLKEESFQKAVQILITWLDRGDCSKRNCGQFYSMIQSTNSHVRRLMNEKGLYEEELLKAKEMLNHRMHGILIQFSQIEKVFLSASHQKVWDHFTKAQRKNIDIWKKQAQEIKNAQLEDALNERIEDEMDLSDEEGFSEDAGGKRPRIEEGFSEQFTILTSQVNNLKEENDSLRCQLEAYKNEVDLIKVDSKHDLDEKSKQLKVLQQALQGMQQQLIQANQQRIKDEEQLQTLRKKLEKDGETGLLAPLDNIDERPLIPECVESLTTIGTVRISNKEARLIGLLSTFLHVHPFGASVDYIWSYLQRLDSALRTSDVENLLLKFPNLFKQELSGVGATLERKWTYVGFQNDFVC